MFTDNLYNLLNWNLTKNANAEDSGYAKSISDYRALYLRPYNYSSTYYLSPTSSNTLFAQQYIDMQINNPFRFCDISMGYCTDSDYDPLKTQTPTGMTTPAIGRSSNLVGDDKKFIEYIFWRVLTASTSVTLNKISLLSTFRNYWHTSTSSGTSSTSDMSFILLSERLSNPVEIKAGESRRFTFKLRFPVFY